MNPIKYYILDVFATNKYEGNQLAVFLDLKNQLSQVQMQEMAREINFAETTFIKEAKENNRFVVKIFTPEHEVPFAGHPSIGTSYIIAKFFLPKVTNKLTLELTHSDIEITIMNASDLDNSVYFMRQEQPQFGDIFSKVEVSNELNIPFENIDDSYPIHEVSTGLPYIIIPIKDLQAMEALMLDLESFKLFLLARNKYRTNSKSGHSTSLFFFTKNAYETGNSYNSRMLLIENNKLSEDAATGSANGCLLAYLLKYEDKKITATVEQGFQMGRKSYLYLDGKLSNEHYEINVGGHNQFISDGIWYV